MEKKEAEPQKKLTLRERNIEKAKVELAVSLEKNARLFAVVTLLLYIGFAALIGVICVANSDSDQDLIMIAKRESSVSTQHISTLKKILKELEEELETARTNMKLYTQEDCRWKFAQSFGSSSDYGDMEGAYDETKCPPHNTGIGSTRDTCDKLCKDNTWTECRLKKMKELGMNDTTCKWWAFAEKDAFLATNPTGSKYIDNEQKCYLHQSWENLGRIRNYVEGGFKPSHIDVGIANCLDHELVRQWREVVLELRSTVFATSRDATKLKSFTHGACAEPLVSYGRRNEFMAEIEMVGGEYSEAAFKPGTDIGRKGRTLCNDICQMRSPECLRRIRSLDMCHVNTRKAKDSGECQEICELESNCLAWNLNKFGQESWYGYTGPAMASFVGNTEPMCKLYKTSHYKADVVDSLAYQEKTQHYTQLVSTAGMRGCEPTDLTSRHYVKYKTTSRIWFPCGVAVKDVEMTGVTANSEVTGVNDWKSCAGQCTEKKDCQVWTLEGKTCSLFNSPGGGTHQHSGTVTGGRNCNDFCDDDFDMAAGDGEVKETGVSDAEACRVKCSSSSTCVHFAWTQSTQECRLLPEVTIRTKKSGIVSGPWHCAIRPKATCPEKVSFNCEYLRRFWSKTMKWQDCAAHCKDDPWCKFWAVGAADKYTQSIPCYLYDTDAGRQSGGSTDGGSVHCQGDTATSTVYNAAKLLTKPFRRPFVNCIHKGMKLSPAESTSGWESSWKIVTPNWETCSDYCEASTVNGVAKVPCEQITMWAGLTSNRYSFKTDVEGLAKGVEAVHCITLDKNATAKTASVSPVCDKNFMYAEKGCKKPATAQALRHYPEYQASFIGYGCHSQRCALGEINGDHVIRFVGSPKDCIAECRKKEQVYVLTYSTGYRTCYCHKSLKSGSYFKDGEDFFPDPNEEFLAYVLS